MLCWRTRGCHWEVVGQATLVSRCLIVKHISIPHRPCGCRDDNVAAAEPVGGQPGRDRPCDGVHAFRRADQMPPVRWSQFVGHLLAIIDEAQGGGDRASRRPMMMTTPGVSKRRHEIHRVNECISMYSGVRQPYCWPLQSVSQSPVPRSWSARSHAWYSVLAREISPLLRLCHQYDISSHDYSPLRFSSFVLLSILSRTRPVL